MHDESKRGLRSKKIILRLVDLVRWLCCDQMRIFDSVFTHGPTAVDVLRFSYSPKFALEIQGGKIILGQHGLKFRICEFGLATPIKSKLALCIHNKYLFNFHLYTRGLKKGF